MTLCCPKLGFSLSVGDCEGDLSSCFHRQNHCEIMSPAFLGDLKQVWRRVSLSSYESESSNQSKAKAKRKPPPAGPARELDRNHTYKYRGGESVKASQYPSGGNRQCFNQRPESVSMFGSVIQVRQGQLIQWLPCVPLWGIPPIWQLGHLTAVTTELPANYWELRL